MVGRAAASLARCSSPAQPAPLPRTFCWPTGRVGPQAAWGGAWGGRTPAAGRAGPLHSQPGQAGWRRAARWLLAQHCYARGTLVATGPPPCAPRSPRSLAPRRGRPHPLAARRGAHTPPTWALQQRAPRSTSVRCPQLLAQLLTQLRPPPPHPTSPTGSQSACCATTAQRCGRRQPSSRRSPSRPSRERSTCWWWSERGRGGGVSQLGAACPAPCWHRRRRRRTPSVGSGALHLPTFGHCGPPFSPPPLL